MERKFDVPDSGYWASEGVFSIPVSTGHDALKGFPGIIVFECTPVQNVRDDIERSVDCPSRFEKPGGSNSL
jgi:hypothetical protein